MSTSLSFSCKDSKEKISCPGDFVIVYMVDFPDYEVVEATAHKKFGVKNYTLPELTTLLMRGVITERKSISPNDQTSDLTS